MMRAQLIEFTATRRRPSGRKDWSRKALLHHLLAVVEVALHRDVVDVVAGHRGHLPALHLGDALVRMQDEDVDVGAAAAALDRRRAGVARGRAQHHDALASPRQRAHPSSRPSSCSAKSLNASVGPWNSSSSHSLWPSCTRGATAGWRNCGVGVARDRAQLVRRQETLHEGLHDRGGEIRVIEPRPGAHLPGAEARQRFRHVQAAVRREAGEHHVFESECGRLAPRADVSQRRSP